MSNLTNSSVTAFLAFGSASIAVAEVKELALDGAISADARNLLVELEVVHNYLRELFAQGHNEAIYSQAAVVMGVASRASAALTQN